MISSTSRSHVRDFSRPAVVTRGASFEKVILRWV